MPAAFRARVSLLIAALAAPWPLTRAHGQAADAAKPAEQPNPDESLLSRELKAMAGARLLSLRDASEADLRALVAKGEQLHLDGRDDEAAVVLLEALESPRFTDFRDFDAYAAGEHIAAKVLLRMGSLQSARRYLERAIERGPSSAYYGPAVRSYVDVAFALGDAKAAADWLDKRRPATGDAWNELRYLRARSQYDAGDHELASKLLDRIDKQSRFYASAQYLLGAIAAERKQYKSAEKRFCAVAAAGADERYPFYVDDRFFEVLDLARLGLGRTAHEMRRGDDAYYYYFQVPRDSKRLPESLFEAAYSSYEARDHDNAIDLLDQLDANFKQSAYSDEASILRGYVSLGRCEFRSADQQFVRFEKHFAPLVAELNRLLESPVRRRVLYDDLIAVDERGSKPKDAVQQSLFALLRVDPEFYRLHAQVRRLDAEAGRAGRVSNELGATLARLQGSDKPLALDREEEDETASERVKRDLELAFALSRSLADELDTLRAAGVKQAQLAPIERQLSQLGGKLDRLEEEAARLNASEKATAIKAPAATGLASTLAQDVERTRALPAEVQAVREQLVAAADARAQAALRELHGRLDGMLRRARIGRIDAVMGSKHRIELQIESLAAGRFPPELRDPLRVQGLLNDDEEYWPFEGEDWSDEYEERYGDEDANAAGDE